MSLDVFSLGVRYALGRGPVVNGVGTGELVIRGIIGYSNQDEEGWFGTWPGEGGTVRQLGDALAALGDVGVLNVFLSSEGGLVSAGLAIHDMLRRHAARKVVHVEGYAYSIATVVAAAGDEVRMAGNGLMMIHNAWTWAEGDAVVMEREVAALRAHDRAIANAYARKSGRPAGEFLPLMERTTWMSGAEARDLGLVDVVVEDVALSARLGGGGGSGAGAGAEARNRYARRLLGAVPGELRERVEGLWAKDWEAERWGRKDGREGAQGTQKDLGGGAGRIDTGGGNEAMKIFPSPLMAAAGVGAGGGGAGAPGVAAAEPVAAPGAPAVAPGGAAPAAVPAPAAVAASAAGQGERVMNLDLGDAAMKAAFDGAVGAAVAAVLPGVVNAAVSAAVTTAMGPVNERLAQLTGLAGTGALAAAQAGAAVAVGAGGGGAGAGAKKVAQLEEEMRNEKDPGKRGVLAVALRKARAEEAGA